MSLRHEPVAIRREAPADYPEIRRIVAAAFGSAAEADLVDRIRSSSHYIADMALVAETDNTLVGHVMVSHASLRSEAGERPVAMLAPLAVDPDHQGAGIGSALVRAVLDAAAAAGEPLVVLQGNPTYYRRFGFEHSVAYGVTMTLPEWAPSEAGQVIPLTTFDPDDRSLRGTVIEPPAFNELD